MLAANFATKQLTTAVQRRDFRTEIKKALLELTTAWPEAGIEASTDGVTVTKLPRQFNRKHLVLDSIRPIAEKQRPTGPFPFTPHCAYLPSQARLSTGVYLHVYLFSQVSYNYIPVDLYFIATSIAKVLRLLYRSLLLLLEICITEVFRDMVFLLA